VNAGSLFGQAAGLALLAAFYPPALLVAALYLGSERPGRGAVLYVLGGLLIVTVIGVAVLLAIRAGGLSHIGQHQTRYGLRLGLGVAAIVASIALYRRRRQSSRPDPATPSDPASPSDPARPPKRNLMERLTTHPKPLAALAVGVVMFGPSLTFVAAVQVVATAKTSVADTVAAMAMIIVLTVAFAWLPLVAYLIAPARTIRTLRTFDAWLKRHGRTVLTATIGIVGIILTIQGITGLA
jgi:hypothetical protein